MNMTFWNRLARLARSLWRGSTLPPTRSREAVAPGVGDRGGWHTFADGAGI